MPSAPATSTLYISDLDGTLLKPDASLPPTSRALLNELISEGLTFSVASARSVVSIQNVLQGLRLKLPVIEFNGAFASDLETGRHEFVNAIDSEIAADVFAMIRDAGRLPLVSSFDGTSDWVSHGRASNEGEHYYLTERRSKQDPRLREMRTPSRVLGEQVVCLTVIGEPEPLQTLEIAIRERHANLVEIHLFENSYSPGWYWLTIHDHRATKDQAVKRLMNTYGLEGHELVAFGDQINDIKLFQIATHAIAVANAVDPLKAHATEIIGSNEEDSVVEFIVDHHSRRTK
ncbi:MAG: HAD family hydrolase [Gammaproteobacteria bacterium]|nr:HAD family hydrolase [Gammaproteobacteria bacterium]